MTTAPPQSGEARPPALRRAAAKDPRFPGRQDWSQWPHYDSSATGFRGYWYPAECQYGVCHLNAFRTQPGTLAAWQADHPGLLLRDEAGELVRDPAWPDEVVLDLGARDGRTTLIDLVVRDVGECARRGHEAVELDNLDSWTRSGGAFGPDEAMAVAVAVAAQARRHGLAVGPKNAPDLLGRADLGAAFDFAVVEECARYDECDAYRAVYGDRVLQVEYADAPGRRTPSGRPAAAVSSCRPRCCATGGSPPPETRLTWSCGARDAGRCRCVAVPVTVVPGIVSPARRAPPGRPRRERSP
jgi:hypothetical protein